MDGNLIFGGEHRDTQKGEEHSDNFVTRRALQTEKNHQTEDVDRTHADDDGRVADGREMKPNREANLIHGHAEKTQIEEYPEVARGEPAPPQSRGFREG